RGIADLFDLAPASERLYFESFWRPTQEIRKGKERRWSLINQQDNLALVALYSLATDLNRVGGEWGHFKESRNQLEHGILLVRRNDVVNTGNQSIVDLGGLDIVSAAEFTNRTFRMLQFTTSAIFSFAFCVRNEGLKSLGQKGQPVRLDKKPGVGKP
ncbi:MAG: LA2681 family HEPN domain-containing protein, partial [Chloroflexi bacterium]|nr:LA2681 family HEPN domain-containing protein [Chloroflexota bacterium]